MSRNIMNSRLRVLLRLLSLAGFTSVPAAAHSMTGGAGFDPLLGWTLAMAGPSWILCMAWWLALYSVDERESDGDKREKGN